MCVCVCVFLGVLMHTWQSEAILGFFLVAKKVVKLLVFPLSCFGAKQL